MNLAFSRRPVVGDNMHEEQVPSPRPLQSIWDYEYFLPTKKVSWISRVSEATYKSPKEVLQTPEKPMGVRAWAHSDWIEVNVSASSCFQRGFDSEVARSCRTPGRFQHA